MNIENGMRERDWDWDWDEENCIVTLLKWNENWRIEELKNWRIEIESWNGLMDGMKWMSHYINKSLNHLTIIHSFIHSFIESNNRICNIINKHKSINQSKNELQSQTQQLKAVHNHSLTNISLALSTNQTH